MATNKLKEAAKKEEAALRINFDEAVEEAKSKAIIVEFQGKEYKLPPMAPAWVPLFVSSRQKDGIISDEDTMELIRDLLGREFIDKIVNDRENFVSLDAVSHKIITPAMKQWGVDVSAKKKKA